MTYNEMNEKHKRRERNYPCVVPNCLGRNSVEIRLYMIPPEDIDAWCTNLQIKPSDVKSTTRVCSRHFETEFKGSLKLKTGARPTLQLEKLATNLPIHVQKTRSNPRKCCIEGCRVMQPPGKVYRFPEDPKRRQEWIALCDIKESAVDNKLKFICGKHFDPSCIAHFRLKKDALPLAQFRRKGKTLGTDFSTTQHQNESDEPLNESDESDFFSDGLECQNFCSSCFNTEEYLVKYLDAEKRCKEAEHQLEEANAQHLIETLALRSQIAELTAELDKQRFLKIV